MEQSIKENTMAEPVKEENTLNSSLTEARGSKAKTNPHLNYVATF